MSLLIRDLILKKKLLIFDFDGTLVDTSKYHQQAFSKILSNKNMHFSYKDIAGMNSQSAFKKIFLQNDHTISSNELITLVKDEQKYARKLIRNHLEINPDVLSFLEWTRNIHAFKSCIVSSGSKDTINTVLEKFKIKHYFEFILSAENIINSKPSPDGFLKALEISGVHPRDAIIFEDSDSGIKSAKNANIEFIKVNNIFWRDLAQTI